MESLVELLSNDKQKWIDILLKIESDYKTTRDENVKLKQTIEQLTAVKNSLVEENKKAQEFYRECLEKKVAVDSHRVLYERIQKSSTKSVFLSSGDNYSIHAIVTRKGNTPRYHMEPLVAKEMGVTTLDVTPMCITNEGGVYDYNDYATRLVRNNGNKTVT